MEKELFRLDVSPCFDVCRSNSFPDMHKYYYYQFILGYYYYYEFINPMKCGEDEGI